MLRLMTAIAEARTLELKVVNPLQEEDHEKGEEKDRARTRRVDR